MNKKQILAAISAAAICMNTTALAELEVKFTDTYFAEVSYITDNACKKAALSVYGTDDTPLYTAESKDIAYDAETGYTVKFKKFKLNSRLPDGEYTIRAGANGAAEEKTFAFDNVPAKLAAYTALKQADTAEKLIEVMDRELIFLGIDEEEYKGLGEYKERFLKALFAELKFDTDDTSGEVTADNLAAHKKVLTDGIDKVKEILSLMCAGENLENVVGTLSLLTLDKTYYDKMTDKSTLVSLYKGLELEKSEKIDFAEISNKFDEMCLLAVIATCDFQTAENAVKYYTQKAVIAAPDYTYYNQLSDKSTAFNTLEDKIKNGTLTDCTKIAEELEAAAETAYNEQTKNTGNTQKPSSTGGGGGGGKPGIVVSAQNNEDDTAQSGKTENTEPATESKTYFPDLGGVAWAADAINALAAEGCISGDENGSFNPNAKITREELVKLAVNAFASADYEAAAEFKDVPSGTWYYPFIASAVKAGIINGISAEEFGVGQYITRQDTAVILARICGRASEETETAFADNENIATYARAAVAALSEMGIITGKENGEFAPTDSLTRAEAAVLIYRLKNIVG